MPKNGNILAAILLLIIINPVSYSNDVRSPGNPIVINQDTTRENQVLYSGRLWRNLYFRIKGDQFLFDPGFLQGSVSIGGNTFTGVPLKYDIYNDEIISHNRRGMFMQLNKEHIDSFTVNYAGKNYNFINLGEKNDPSGFMRLVYNGTTKFLIRYRKNIELMAVDKKYDSFYQVRKLYMVKDSTYHSFSGRMELLRLFGDDRKAVKTFMRKNRIKIEKQEPETYIPVFEYYDSLSR